MSKLEEYKREPLVSEAGEASEEVKQEFEDAVIADPETGIPDNILRLLELKQAYSETKRSKDGKVNSISIFSNDGRMIYFQDVEFLEEIHDEARKELKERSLKEWPKEKVETWG